MAAIVGSATQLTLDVLQQGILSKVPPCPFARVAGENGLKLTRAAFAAILKHSEQLESFKNLSLEVESCETDLAAEAEG